MTIRTFYDTCVFLNSLNPEHWQFEACKRITQEHSFISWIIYFSEYSRVEANISEFLTAFYVDCLSNGTLVVEVSNESTKKQKKKVNSYKRGYTTAGLSTKDWSQLNSAILSESDYLISTDEDFWDPSNKANSGGDHFSPNAHVRRKIITDFHISSLLPSELIDLVSTETSES